MIDRSNGWEAVAAQLIALRSPTIGVSTLDKWIASLPARGAVLDLGCGAGIPVSESLVKAGFDVTLVGEYLDEGENHYYDTRKDSAVTFSLADALLS